MAAQGAAAAAPPFRIATVVWAMAVVAGAARWGRSRAQAALALALALALARTNVLIRRHVKQGGGRKAGRQGERHEQREAAGGRRVGVACKLMHS